MEEVKPQDAASGLVEREWTRTTGKRGQLTLRTREGEQVEATFLDRHGGLQHAAGTVRRNEAGNLVVESWADGIRSETAILRDANVESKGRTPR